MENNIPSAAETPPQQDIPEEGSAGLWWETHKRHFIVSGSVLSTLLVIVLVGLYFFPLDTKVPAQQEEKKQAQVPTVAVKPLAEDVVSYVASQRRADGYYNYFSHYNELCQKENGVEKCLLNGINFYEITDSWTSLGYFGAFKIFEDPLYLDSMNKDLGILMNYCQNRREDCSWALTQPAIIYQATKEPKLFDFLKAQAEVLLQTTAAQDGLMTTAIEVRELALMYQVTQEIKYLHEANKRFITSVRQIAVAQNAYAKGNTRFPQQLCWYTLGELELAKIQGKETHLKQVDEMLRRADIVNHFNEISFVIHIQPCIESYITLDTLNGNKANKQTITLLMEKFTKGFLDTPQNKLIYGEGGTTTIQFGKDIEKISSNAYDRQINITDSSYTLYLLSLYQQYQTQ